MKERIDHEGQDGASRKTKSPSLKSVREAKKLEWTVIYKKAKVDTRLGIFEGASMSRCK